jgi:hypothetical protein
LIANWQAQSPTSKTSIFWVWETSEFDQSSWPFLPPFCTKVSAGTQLDSCANPETWASASSWQDLSSCHNSSTLSSKNPKPQWPSDQIYIIKLKHLIQ